MLADSSDSDSAASADEVGVRALESAQMCLSMGRAHSAYCLRILFALLNHEKIISLWQNRKIAAYALEKVLQVQMSDPCESFFGPGFCSAGNELITSVVARTLKTGALDRRASR